MALTDKLTAIADAIREKAGNSEPMTLTQMPAAIAGIDGSIHSLVNGTVTEYSNTDIKTISEFAFYAKKHLKSINCPSVTKIGFDAFENCHSLSTVDFPNLVTLGGAAFSYCISLTTVNLPQLESVPSVAFYECRNLANIYIPNARDIGSNAFAGVSARKIRLTCANLNNIDSFAFAGNSNLITFVITRTSGVCTLSDSYAFHGTPIANGKGYVYVPAALVNKYKTATNWVTYAKQIRAIEDYPDIVGE